jgi:hypothetical protein
MSPRRNASRRAVHFDWSSASSAARSKTWMIAGVVVRCPWTSVTVTIGA